MNKEKSKTKSGATSLYVVVFASLLFSVITIGFVSLILSESYNTNNDELSQSAHDAALAGVEDAKLAIIDCNSTTPSAHCDLINKTVEQGGCETPAQILGRPAAEGGGTIVSETGSSAHGETNQAYTCVTIRNVLPDYRSSLSFTDTDSTRLVPLASSHTKDAKAIRLSWYSNTDNQNLKYLDLNAAKTAAVFHTIANGVSEPPSLSVTLIQTAASFMADDGEDYSHGDKTDRGTLVLVPSPTSGHTKIGNHMNTHGIYGGVPAASTATSGFIKANDKTKTNESYLVKCQPNIGDEFVCSVIIELPEPIGGQRSASTSLLGISMLYGQPSTDFRVELCADTDCTSLYNFEGAQYAIDSTGRAADVYSRVEHRVEIYDAYYPFPAFALQLNGTGTDLDKIYWSTISNCLYSDDDEVSGCTLTSGRFSGTNHKY